MTEQTGNPTARTDDFTTDLAITSTSIQWDIDRLRLATEAMRLALEAANPEARLSRHNEPMPAQILENWRAGGVLLERVLAI